VLFAAGWTDDLWAKSLMDTPPNMPLTLDDDVAPIAQAYRHEALENLAALRRPAALGSWETPRPEVTPGSRPPEAPPPLPRSTRPLLAQMSLQR
jgi:hypothetical protein